MLQVALAASLASLSAAALAEEVGDELGMLWPTRVLPALLRALPYLALYTDRWTSHVPLCASTSTGLLAKRHYGTPQSNSLPMAVLPCATHGCALQSAVPASPWQIFLVQCNSFPDLCVASWPANLICSFHMNGGRGSYVA